MNTPRSRKLLRYTNVRPPVIGRAPQPDGTYSGALMDEKLLLLLGQIISYMPQVEERIVEFMAVLIGDTDDLGFLDKREISEGEMPALVKDMDKLWQMILAIEYPKTGQHAPALPQIPAPQHDE